MTERRGRVLGFSALEAADFRQWLEAELRLARRARERGAVPENVYVRVLALLALAASPNTHEARSAQAKADALLREYDLTLADVEHWRRQGR